jgi:hypothetical protein
MPRKNIAIKNMVGYLLTSSGVSVTDFDVDIHNPQYHVTYSGGTSLYANDSHLYMSTTNSGVLRSSISGTISFSVYKQYPSILSNNVNYIHGAGDYICLTSMVGVDRYKISTSARYYTTVSGGAGKCFQATNGDFYYGTDNPANVHVYYEATGSGYTYGPYGDYDYFTTSGINDIYVTEGTSTYNNGNVLFIATTYGVRIIEERRGDEANCRKKTIFRDLTYGI